MSKTERLFPLSTMGGKIQNRRITLLNKTRPEFYDLLRPGENISNESKSRTIKNWESGDTIPDIDTIKKICTVLKCSSDYLLGLDTCTNRDNEFIHKRSGLSESNIERLANWKENSNKQGEGYDWARNSIKALNSLLDCDNWFYHNVLNEIANYCYYRMEFENNEDLNRHQKTECLQKYQLALFNATNGLRDCMEKDIYKNNNKKAPGTS